MIYVPDLELTMCQIPEINALIARFETSTTHWSKPSQQPYIMNNTSHISAWHTLDRVQLLKDQVRVVRDLLDLEPESKCKETSGYTLLWINMAFKRGITNIGTLFGPAQTSKWC